MNSVQRLAGLVAGILLLGGTLGPARAQQSHPIPADAGLVTLPSKHPAPETIKRFEAAVRDKGWMVFTTLDHQQAAEAAGLELRPRTVIVFGNPKAGTQAMRTHPTLAIDLPLKALVWQDDQGKVWLTYNTAEYIGSRVYARHGLTMGKQPLQGLSNLLTDIARVATQ